MKILLTLLLASALGGTVTWLNDLSTAKAEAAKSHKKILLNFSGSDWCGPCIRMHKQIFESAAFDQYAASNLVLVKADFPRLRRNQLPAEQMKINDALAEKYNPGGKFPYTLILDETGKVLKTWEGLPNLSPEQFVAEVNAVTHAGR